MVLAQVEVVGVARGLADAACENFGACVEAQEDEAVFGVEEDLHVAQKGAFFGGGEENFMYGLLAAGSVNAYKVEDGGKTARFAHVVGGKVKLMLGHG